MNYSKLVFYNIIISFFILVSCDNDSNNLIPEPIPVIPEDTTYNSAYEDSILFNSSRILGNTNVQIGSINGTGIRQLCDSLVSYDASWSSNKRKILFIGSRLYGSYENWGIYQMDVKDYKIKRIVPQDSLVNDAAYSPDMKYIAYAVWRNESPFNKVKLLDIETGIVRDLTDWINNDIYTLTWSPNSKDILIDNGYVININTPGLRVLFTFNYGQIFIPVWSPDGTKIAFCGQAQNGWSNIYIHNLTTGENKLLYPQELFQYTCSWSKDGNQIIFSQRPAGNSNNFLCKINTDGTNFVQITDGTEDNWKPCWYK